MRFRRILSAFLFSLALPVLLPAADAPTTAPPAPSASPPADAAPLGLAADDVRHHLGHVIDWYHRLGGLGPTAALTDDIVTRERLHQLRLTEVRLAFVFGRAAAPLVDDGDVRAPAPDGGIVDDGAPRDRLQERMEDRARELRGEIAALDTRIGATPAAQRPVLQAQRAQLNAALLLTNEVLATELRLQQFAARSNSSASGETGLLADITDMERTVPEARTAGASAPAAAPASKDAVDAASSAYAPRRDAGLVSLANEWFALRDTIKLHNHFVDATDALSTALDALSKGLAGHVRELLRTASTTATTTDARELSNARAAIENATRRFRELSTLLIPLGEESITLDSARELLAQRRATLESRANSIVSQLALRLGLLVASVLVILGVSSVWRRATFRYLHDPRRRRQFLTLRRAATGVALIIVVFVAFLSEVGSLATYIGFLTAGLAVALQNVILAVVAYFFLIGRYGVRVGDRITLAGVTGRVAEIGLVRLYLTELAGPELTPTGRLIVLSNAVIFQPQAMFKQLPGVEYAWHTLSFTLSPSADPVLARERLQARALQVYDSYRETIETHLKAARNLTDFDAINPQPEVSAKFNAQGIDVFVRYPVPTDQAAQIDQHMSKELRAALDDEPPLLLASAADAAPAG